MCPGPIGTGVAALSAPAVVPGGPATPSLLSLDNPAGPGEAFTQMFCDIVTDVIQNAPSHGCQDRRGEPVEDSSVAVVVEDDADIRELILTVLEQAGFTVHTAATGAEGLELVRRLHPVVTTLDVSMPGMDGFETARRIRAISGTYIVMLTARTEEIDTLQGLQAGADDYLTKPFRPRELRARVEAMLRRPRTVGGEPAGGPSSASTPGVPPVPDHEWLRHRGLHLNPTTRIAQVDGHELELTRSEFDILSELLSAGRRVVSKAELALVVRGERHLGSAAYVTSQDTRAIEVHMANLRRKLGESPIDPRWIETVRGVGYRLTST